MKPLAVLSVASEAFPFVKTGGLADVVGALPGALAAEGIHVRTLVPGYPAVLAALPVAAVVLVLAQLHGGPARVLAGRAAGVDLLALDAPHLFARPGNPYLGADGREWPDNALRFAALAAVAADLGRGRVPELRPDIVHAHDWQAGLVPAFLRYGTGAHARTVMTVHNLAFQGQFPHELLATLGLPPRAFAIDGVEYYGSIGFLKAGLALADRITTVSPTYAGEIRTPDGGMGLDGLLRQRAAVLCGILNGIDTVAWDPAADPLLPSNFDVRSLPRRSANKSALQARFGLAADPGALLFGVVSRLTWQKGMDLLQEALPAIDRARAQLVVLGAGDPPLEAAFTAAAALRPGRMATLIGYDERLAHLVQAGSDALLVPSRFEPCGLTQLAALRYGSLPVVARVGGLADTVVDANEMALASSAGTGIVFSPVSRETLELAIDRTAALWRQAMIWRRVQVRAMFTDVSWARPARRYATLYRELVAHPQH
jgi:starch synthase